MCCRIDFYLKNYYHILFAPSTTSQQCKRNCCYNSHWMLSNLDRPWRGVIVEYFTHVTYNRHVYLVANLRFMSPTTSSFTPLKVGQVGGGGAPPVNLAQPRSHHTTNTELERPFLPLVSRFRLGRVLHILFMTVRRIYSIASAFMTIRFRSPYGWTIFRLKKEKQSTPPMGKKEGGGGPHPSRLWW